MKFNFAHLRKKKPGRPPISKECELLIVKLARENRFWGCDTIQGHLKTLGFIVSDTTVSNILKRHGIEPAPERKKNTTWKEFIQSHMDVIYATDFFTTEVWTKFGLFTYYVLFFIHLETRRVYLGGITTNPNSAWMVQAARNATMPDWGFLDGCKYLIHDRDSKFMSSGFRYEMQMMNIQTVPTPPKSPNLNAFAERFVRSIKDECLNRFIPLGEKFTRKVVEEYLEYYNTERPHQGKDIGNELLIPEAERKDLANRSGPVRKKSRLGGLLNSYYRLSS
ncbi:integrase core domain-containing protein [Planctomycetota bacterium]